MSDFPNLIEVLAMHHEVIVRYGGSPEIRDMGLLEAALFRPQTGYYIDTLEEAAALWESLSQNHAFVDGNKRVAFAVTHVFLRMNGYQLKPEAPAIIEFVSALYEDNTFEFAFLLKWLKGNVTKEA